MLDTSPTEVELPVWTQVEEVLQRTDEILLELSVYHGATLQIRDVRMRLVSPQFSVNFFGRISHLVKEDLVVCGSAFVKAAGVT